MSYEKAVEELARLVMSGDIKNREELNRWKIKVSRKYHLSKIPGNSDILKAIARLVRESGDVQVPVEEGHKLVAVHGYHPIVSPTE